MKTTTKSLFSDNTCNGTKTSKMRLAPLGNYGGPTQTIALRADSSAIGAGSCTNDSTDQRGIERGSSCDVGAFERLCPSIDCQIVNNKNVCTLDIWVDFQNPAESSDGVMNSGGCAVDVIPSGTNQLQWMIIPLNKYVGTNAKDISVNENIYTPTPQAHVGSHTNDRLTPCIFQTTLVEPQEPSEDGWVVYGYSDLQSDPNDCVFFARPTQSGCNCVPPRGRYWWYGIDWSGLEHHGDWDPRMRPETTEHPDPREDP